MMPARRRSIFIREIGAIRIYQVGLRGMPLGLSPNRSIFLPGGLQLQNSESSSTADGKRQLLRHTVATVAYRGRKVLTGAPEGFSQFRIGETSRTPGEILAHICDLYDWANWLVKGEHVYNESTPVEWAADVDRFFAGLAKLDAWLASEEPLGRSPELLFQGPIADSLTHIGQIALLRRMAGAPVRGESYLRADITVGRVGPDQPPPNWEFD